MVQQRDVLMLTAQRRQVQKDIGQRRRASRRLLSCRAQLSEDNRILEEVLSLSAYQPAFVFE